MTEIIHRIPFEIWINVFGRLYKKDLCQCRLVCQTWNQPAERAIFSSNIYLPGEKSAKKLYQLLEEKPQLARLIKKISVHLFYYRSGQETIRKLLKASFTSNMEHVDVSSDQANSAFFATLINAAESSGDTNFRLKSLPSPQDDEFDDECYLKAAHIFRESLETLKVPLNCKEMNTLLRGLEGFKSLKTLELNIKTFHGVEELEAVLKHVGSLVDLQLSFPPRDRGDDDDYMAQDESSVLTWAVQHVKQVKTVKQVAIDRPYLDLVHYVIYKYSNMELLACYGMGFYEERLCLGLLDAAKSLPRFCTKFFYHGHQQLQPSISSICALNNMPHNISISFQYSIKAGISEDYGASMGVQTRRDDSNNTLEFGIDLDRILSTTVPVNIMEHLRTALDANYTIDKVDLNAVLFRPIDILEEEEEDDDELHPFYYILNNFPRLKHLKLSTQKIQHKDMIATSQIETLKLEFAEVDAQVLPQISQQLPRLYLLDIGNCAILDEQQQQRQDEIRINVPHSSLALLNVQVKKELFVAVDHYHGMMEKCDTSHICYLHLTILDVNMTLYCKLEKYMAIVQLSHEQFEARPDKEETVTIVVTCGSVARIHLEMGYTLRPQINVDEFVLRKLQSQIDHLRTEALNSGSQEEENTVAKELDDKEQMYNSYLGKSKLFNQKLDNIDWPYFIFKNNVSLIKDVPTDDENQ